ncbi:MAG: peptidyl-prolyl cis-trans isomerase [Actinomycetota bacterium]|nr:peptidyl-prolyl cis-trans isomerase [Actinomycetota bacterium]
MRRVSNRTAAIVFAVVLAILVVLVGATMGIGKVSLPDGAVAFVDGVEGGEIGQEEFDAAIGQASARQREGEAPEPGTPQFEQQKVPAVSDLLLGRWVKGEATDREIAPISDQEIDTELETIIDEQFGGQEEFDKFLEDSGFSEEDARERVELQILTQCLQDKVIPRDPSLDDDPNAPQPRAGCESDEEVDVSDDDIQAFYDDNIAQFETPETRDVRTLLNPDEDKAQEAADLLAEDASAENWKAVTKELSTDEATKDLGGLRPGVAPGQNEPALDEAIFSAAEGEIVGPVETEAGFYVVEVEAVNAAATQPLDAATEDQIRAQLVTQEQQQAVTDFQDGFISKWRSRTVCSEDLLANDDDGTIEAQLAERCSNFSVPDDGCLADDPDDELLPDPTTGEVPTEPEGCGAFVPSRPVVPPLPLLDADAQDPTAVPTSAPAGTALPQGVQGPSVQALPQDALPLGVPPTGAPPTGAPPTGAPPTGAPPTGAPPTGAPPTGAPPTGAPPPGASPTGAPPAP